MSTDTTRLFIEGAPFAHWITDEPMWPPRYGGVNSAGNPGDEMAEVAW